MTTETTRTSVRQPLVLYGTIFMLLFASFVVTVASQSLIDAAQRAYRRALLDEIRRLAQGADLGAIERALATRPPSSEIEMGLVTSSSSALGLDLVDARGLAERTDGSRRLIAARVPLEGREAYVVASFPMTVPSAIAYVEISRMILPVVLGALVSAWLLGVMLRRLLVPQLSALAEIARDPTIRGDRLSGDGDAPNEIIEVAQAFRRTIRQLNEERERLKAQHSELERMHQSLVRASKLASVGRLAAGIAHEIGNPLAAVQGYMSLMPRLDEKERAEVLDRSARELKRIHETIKKLLTYARQDDATEPLVPVHLHTVIEDAILLVRGHPALRSVQIESSVPLEPQPDALGHPGRLGQVLVNLLLNAAHAMERSETQRISLRRRVEGQAVILEVEDTGPGIPEDKLEQIFDPFYTTKAPGEGTGLGLAVSRSLMEGMTGALEASTAPGGGAVFALSLPRPGLT